MKLKLCIIGLCLALILALTGCTLPAASNKSGSESSTAVSSSQQQGSSPPPASNSTPAGSQQPFSSSLPSVTLSDSPLTLETLLESLYLQVNPSVVNIEVIEKAQALFPGFPGLQVTPGQEQLTRASGSGFVWDAEGHIVTNNHVVAGVQSISVTFSDGNTYSASLVGADPDSDLAVIKVDDVPAQELHPVKIGDSTQLRVGQLAVAIGNPFGLQSTMTVGFISGLGRLLPADENALGTTYSIPDIIQTDASLNPGNSGGVLLNAAGLVIGVTSAIATESGSSAGVGFAIPSAIVGKVVPSLIRSGKYTHPWLGVSLITLTPDISKAMDLNANQRGALVEQVMAGSPADKAGLQASSQRVTLNGASLNVGGDVITAYDGKTVKSSDDLISYLAASGYAGQTVSLTVLRKGQQIQTPVTLEARPGT